MNFIGHEKYRTSSFIPRDGNNVPEACISSPKIRGLKEKFLMADGADKNLFKIICSIENMPLKQRNQNPLYDDTLMKMLDTIDFDVFDDDLIVLNQLAVITRLANRNPFSLDDHQMTLIHNKFYNFFA